MNRLDDIILNEKDVEIIEDSTEETVTETVSEHTKDEVTESENSNITNISDFDLETQDKIRKAFEEKGIDFDSSLSGNQGKLPKQFIDPEKVVQGYNELDDDLKEKVKEALNTAVTNDEGEEYKSIEEQMEDLKTKIDWDTIELDEDDIPIVTEEDKNRIISIGASTGELLNDIIKSARDSIKIAREEIPELEERGKEFKFEDTHFEDKEIRDKYIDAKYKWKNEYDQTVNLEKTSKETLAVFQQLSRQTVEDLIKDNAFVRTLSLIANKAFISLYPEALTHGVSGAIYKELLSFVSDNKNDSFINSYLKLKYNPHIPSKGKPTPYDDLYSIVNHTITKNPDEEINDTINKVYSALNSIDKIYKYPFVVASKYIPDVDIFFTKTELTDEETEKCGWPSKEKVEDLFSHDIETIKDKLDTIYDILTDSDNVNNLEQSFTFLHNALVVSVNNLQNKKHNTYTKKLKNFTKHVSSSSLASLFRIIITGVTETQTDEDIKPEKISSENLTRYTYLSVLFSVLESLYAKVTVRIIKKLEDSDFLKNHSDALNDIIKYIYSEIFLSIDIIQRFDTSKLDDEDIPEEKRNTIKNFINEEIYRTLGEEVYIIFDNMDVDKTRLETIGVSFKLISIALSKSIVLLKTILEDKNDDLFTPFS